MIKVNKQNNAAVTAAQMQHREKVHERIRLAAAAETSELFGKFGTRMEGLSESLVEALRNNYGENQVTRGERHLSPSGLRRHF